MKIERYNEETDYAGLIKLLESEKDWKWFLEDKTLSKHKKSLSSSVTYVVYAAGELAGYLRSIEDMESFIYVCELLVNEKFRGANTGKKLLDRLNADFPDYEIYVLSDEDMYYEKTGCTLKGSIFKV